MEPHPENSARLKVLVVEDEFLIAMELRRLLHDAGYDVMGPVATVPAALALIDSDRPDACVLDVNLRGMNSSPVGQALIGASIPFLLSSAYERGTLEQHAVFNGVVNLGKPVRAEKLLSTLASLVGEQKWTAPAK